MGVSSARAIEYTTQGPLFCKSDIAKMGSVYMQILSDLHLETHPSYDYSFKQTARYLALLGDIGHAADDGLFEFLEKQLQRFQKVFYLLGNHEPVDTTWNIARARMRAFAERMEELRSRTTIGQFILLDQTRCDVNETLTVLGCTLFSKITDEEAVGIGRRMIDFHRIREWTVADHLVAHSFDLEWLNTHVKQIAETEPKRRIAIFTHHSPTYDSRARDPRHEGSTVMSGFASDLSAQECWTNAAVVLWGFGHTHFSCDFVDEHGKKIIANQKGYHMRKQPNFDAGKTFEVGSAR